MLNKIDSKTFYNTVLPVIIEVGAYQKSRYNTSFKVEFKGDINLVTDVDKKSEEILVRTINTKFPDHDILAEEGTGQRRDSPYKWIIDPLDGTTNFAHGYPLFSISVALEYKNDIIGGVVYDPLRDEIFRAFRGNGAFLNDRPITISATPSLDRALLATGFAYNFKKAADNNLSHFNNMLYRAQAVRRDGVASVDLCYVACGRFDGFWELNLYPWDTAAGTLVATEAGAKLTKFDSSKYSIYEKDILISNGRIHKEMIAVLEMGRLS